MVVVIHIGITEHEIPLECKIIKVADEFDGIVNKRQYKSHVGICDALNILYEQVETHKIDGKIFKALVKIVIDDIQHEMDILEEYVEHLEANLNRLQEIQYYKSQADGAFDIADKQKFQQAMLRLLEPGETPINVLQILSEYNTVYSSKVQQLENLKKELKIIKHMK